jgi:hypothetical protein
MLGQITDKICHPSETRATLCHSIIYKMSWNTGRDSTGNFAPDWYPASPLGRARERMSGWQNYWGLMREEMILGGSRRSRNPQSESARTPEVECPICALPTKFAVACSACGAGHCQMCTVRSMCEGLGCPTCKEDFDLAHFLIAAPVLKKAALKRLRAHYGQLHLIHARTAKASEAVAALRALVLEYGRAFLEEAGITLPRTFEGTTAATPLAGLLLEDVCLGHPAFEREAGSGNVPAAPAAGDSISSGRAEAGAIPSDEAVPEPDASSFGRECPGCRAPIFKSEGCDDIWCTRCHTKFKYSTGELIAPNVFFHNPEMFAWIEAGRPAPEIAAWGIFFRRGHAEGLVRPASPEPRLTGNWAQYCADAFSCVKAAIVRATYTARIAADAEAISEAPDQAPVIAKATLEWLEARKDLYGASDLISYYRMIEKRRRPALPEEQPPRRQDQGSVREWRLLAPEMQLQRWSRLDPALGRTPLWRQMTEMEHIRLWRFLQDPERRELWAMLGQRGQGVLWDEMRHLDQMIWNPSLRRNKTDLWGMLTDQERLSLWVQMDEPAKRETWFALDLLARAHLWALLVHLDWTSGEPLNQVGLWDLLAFGQRRSELLDQLSATQQLELWEVLPEPQTHVLWRLLSELRQRDLWELLSAEQRQIFLAQTPMHEQRGVPDQAGQEADSGQSSEDDDSDDGGVGGHGTIRAEPAALDQVRPIDPWMAPGAMAGPDGGRDGETRRWEGHNHWVRMTPLERHNFWARMTAPDRRRFWAQLTQLEQRNLWMTMPTSDLRRIHWDLLMELDPPGIRMSPEMGVRRQDLWGLLDEDEQRALWIRLSEPQKIDLWERLVHQNEPQQHQVWDILTDEERADFLGLLSTRNRFDLWAHPDTVLAVLNWLAISGTLDLWERLSPQQQNYLWRRMTPRQRGRVWHGRVSDSDRASEEDEEEEEDDVDDADTDDGEVPPWGQ